jgi:uncharacterized membrane protein
MKLRALSLVLQCGFYASAGINHFLNPGFYYPLIPPYLPWPVAINYAAGIAEVVFAVLLWLPATRRWAAYGIVAMLVAFIPSHWYMIELGGCAPGSLCVPLWVVHVRLWVVHPLLALWAWAHRK